jgi:hypothetical protein
MCPESTTDGRHLLLTETDRRSTLHPRDPGLEPLIDFGKGIADFFVAQQVDEDAHDLNGEFTDGIACWTIHGLFLLTLVTVVVGNRPTDRLAFLLFLGLFGIAGLGCRNFLIRDDRLWVILVPGGDHHRFHFRNLLRMRQTDPEQNQQHGADDEVELRFR